VVSLTKLYCITQKIAGQAAHTEISDLSRRMARIYPYVITQIAVLTDVCNLTIDALSLDSDKEKTYKPTTNEIEKTS